MDLGPSLGFGPKLPKRFKLQALAVFVIIVCLVIAGVAAWQHFSHSKAKTPTPTMAVQHASASSNNQTEAGTQIRTYTATNFSLNFKYPDTWTIVNNGTGPITVTSPSTQLVSATGQKVNGQVIMTIQAQGQLPAAFTAGTVLAVLSSQKYMYTDPTTSQNVQTYLSFVQYSTTTTKGGLDGIYLTGNDGYTKDQVIPSTDVAAINPLITMTFYKCGNSACTMNLTPLTIASTDWSNNSFKTPIVNMLRSFAFE
jgi:cytoskeletal protein RodZ